ncbi:hypothetical protein FHG87_005084 [Trinorchestia longiramus]|nr:hypothetical protein FHG87_005084 [Trinorchestia longiramus]
MEGDESFSEDEWSEVKRRFAQEGLQLEDASGAAGVLHVWRWLSDAEANLKAARHINEKLQRQHQEELLRELSKSEAPAAAAEQLCPALQKQLDEALAGRDAVTAMLKKEELCDIAQAPLAEQIAYLLVERRRLLEDADTRGNPYSDREKELTSNLIKASTDLELSRRSETAAAATAADLERRCVQLEKTTNQLRIDNDSLAFKLSEAYAELEENDAEIRRLMKSQGASHGAEPAFPVPLSVNDSHHSLPHDFGEGGAAEEEYSPPLSERISKRDRADATRNKSTRRLSRMLDSDYCKGEGVPEDVKQYKETVAELKAESSALRSRLVTAEDRLEEALKELERHRIRSRGRLQAVRLRHKNECLKMEVKTKELGSKWKAGLTRSEAQEARCGALEDELQKVTADNYSLRQRIIEDEELMASSLVQQDVAEEKISMLVQTNARLNDQVQKLLIRKTILGIEALRNSFDVPFGTGGVQMTRRASTS